MLTTIVNTTSPLRFPFLLFYFFFASLFSPLAQETSLFHSYSHSAKSPLLHPTH